MKIGLIVNEQKSKYDDYTSLTQDCFLMFLPKMNYQSIEVVKGNVVGLTEMLLEYLQDIKALPVEERFKKEIRNLHTRLTKFLRYFPMIRSKDKQISRVYEFLLSLDGMGTLAGFGFGNKFGDKLKGDSEKESTIGRTLLRE